MVRASKATGAVTTYASVMHEVCCCSRHRQKRLGTSQECLCSHFILDGVLLEALVYAEAGFGSPCTPRETADG